MGQHEGPSPPFDHLPSPIQRLDRCPMRVRADLRAFKKRCTPELISHIAPSSSNLLEAPPPFGCRLPFPTPSPCFSPGKVTFSGISDKPAAFPRAIPSSFDVRACCPGEGSGPYRRAPTDLSVGLRSMASAVLASRNEPCWGEQKAFMRKPSIPNPNPRSGTLISVSGDRAAVRPSNFSSRDADLGFPPIVGAGPRSAASDEDSSSLNPWLDNAAAVAGSGVAGCLRFNISALSKSDLMDLKRRLASELEQVRGVINRIETVELQSLSRSASLAARFSSSSAPGKEKVFAGVTGVHHLSFSPRAKLLGATALESEKLLKSIMAKCGQILAKLMKPKKSIWFNSPVDVVGLGLHDYHNVIKSPMDLGSVKTKHNKGLYASPVEFAADIRLTFNNALVYNHQTHEVYKIAESLLSQFEGMYEPVFDKYQRQLREFEQEEDHGPTTVPSSHFLVPETSALGSEKKHSLPKAQAMIPTPSPIPTPVPSQPPPFFPPKHHHVVANKEPTGRLPKPKARDPNKRTMSFEEKKKLGQGLESLPLDKMAQVVQIIRKRKVDAMQDGDEIELDIELMDTETLWELDRFLYNCKKMMSKVRKQGNTASGLIHEGNFVVRPTHLPMEDVEKSPLPVGTPDVGTAKNSKKGDTGDEDVDILDDMPPAHYPSVEIEKDVASSSSSSSDSDSSSSSGSDSETSSGSSSDEDDPQPSCPGGRSSPGN